MVYIIPPHSSANLIVMDNVIYIFISELQRKPYLRFDFEPLGLRRSLTCDFEPRGECTVFSHPEPFEGVNLFAVLYDVPV